MPPKKNKNQTKVLKKTVNATKGKNKKNSPSKNARKPPPKKSAKIKGKENNNPNLTLESCAVVHYGSMCYLFLLFFQSILF